MIGLDKEDDDAIYHSTKFVEDVPLLIIAEIDMHSLLTNA